MPVEIFCCYARKDQPLLIELKAHLMPLQRQGLITIWADTDIEAGTEWEREINQHLNSAQIILLLVSPDFMASEYCYSTEMQRALERHKRGEAHVIPIILRQVYWQGAPFSTLQALPTDGKPVTDSSWITKDYAFFNIAQGLKEIVEESVHTPDNAIETHLKLTIKFFKRGLKFYDQGEYTEAVKAFIQVLQIDPINIGALYYIGLSWQHLGVYEEALKAYDQVITLDQTMSSVFLYKGVVLRNIENYIEAIGALNEAIRLNGPNNVSNVLHWALFNKGLALGKIGRYGEALQLFEEVIAIDPTNSNPFYLKGMTLEKLGNPLEALKAFDRATRLNPQNAGAFYRIGEILNSYSPSYDTKSIEKALKAYERAAQLGLANSDVYFKIGLLCSHWFNRLPEALEAFNKATTLKGPDAVRFQLPFERATVLYRLGKYPEALEALAEPLAHERTMKSVYGSKDSSDTKFISPAARLASEIREKMGNSDF